MRITKSKLCAIVTDDHEVGAEETLICVSGDGQPYISLANFELRDGDGTCVGSFKLKDGAWIDLPLSKFNYYPEDDDSS